MSDESNHSLLMTHHSSLASEKRSRMKIGITFDLKSDAPLPAGLPDDFQEEFDSPVTVEGIASVLRNLGHEVVPLGDGRELLQRLLTDPPDLVFNIAEGQGIARS